MIKNFKDLLKKNANKATQTIAVVAPNDEEILQVIQEAEKQKMADFILVGDKSKIQAIMKERAIKLGATIVDEPNNVKAATRAVALVNDKKADVLMKGLLQSSEFLKPILNRETGLNIGKRITQISVLEKEEGGLRMITDAAITVEPDLLTKKEIIENAVYLAHKLGNPEPKVAVLASLEVVNPNMQETLDAAVLSKMNERQQIKGCLVDGPLAYDNAVSMEAAKQKGLTNPVAGQADILVVPNLTVGNVLTKAVTYTAEKQVIAATIGAGVPIVFTSRSESMEGKLLSIALASYIS